MNKMTTTTLPSFLNGRGIGFERMFDLLEDTTTFSKSAGTFPPYNIIQMNDDDYIIELAVAGFGIDDLEITQDANKLRVDGRRPEIEDDGVKFLHRGMAGRAFTREFVLAEHMIVEDAAMENGILSVKLHRELPDALKPRQIEIKKIVK